MSTYTLIDSHAHIYGPDFKDDFAEMLQRAEDAGVGEMIVVGTDLATSRTVCELAEKYPHLYCAVGIHPHDAAEVTEETYRAIHDLATGCSKVVAIGEIGLDFYRDRSPRPIQEEVFRRFIRLAKELSLPVIIHDRDAHERVLAIVREEQASAVGGVFHCFSGDLQMAGECIDLGFYISIPGTVTYPSNEALRQVVRGTKIEKMLVETDCPYLTPVPHRGKRNEPAFVSHTAAKVAVVKGLSIEDVARITTHNVRTLFNIGTADQNARIAYRIRSSLYLNITNRCSNRCSFCAKFDDFTVKGHYLLLDHEPAFNEVMAAIAEHRDYDEVVFCGYGEPLLRLDLIREIAIELKKHGVKTRINTDGQANLVYGRNILPELAGLIDCVSVSLNAADAETYDRLCHTPFGKDGFAGVCDFLRLATSCIPKVVASAVTVPGLDIQPVKDLARSLGVEFREREYAEVG